jgi:ubiquinone/menaquinone biosynthesis C-methylase UbiE
MIRDFLPYFIYRRLFGDRLKYQDKFLENDNDWIKWSNYYSKFYSDTQTKGIGSKVNKWGYKILNNINFKGKTVLEIGPGNLPHLSYWNGTPNKFIVIDVNDRFFNEIDQKLSKKNIITKKYIIKTNDELEISENNIDIILSFYSLEHLSNLKQYLNFFDLKLKKDGLLVYACPNEGGLAWGLGRYLYTRRRIHKNTNLNYDKIICWEHPNFIDDINMQVKNLDYKLLKNESYPFGKFLPLDLNLVSSFIYKK